MVTDCCKGAVTLTKFCQNFTDKKGPLFIVSSCIKQAQKEVTFIPISFLLVITANLCEQLGHERNVHGEIYHHHAKFQIAWIPT